jgi:hypothetical protein
VSRNLPQSAPLFKSGAPSFDLMNIYQRAAHAADVAGVFSLLYSEPATEKGKSTKPFVQHFKPESMEQLVAVAQNYCASMNTYFTPNLRRVDVRKGNGIGKFEDISTVLSFVLEEDADERKYVTLPPGVKPTAVIRSSSIPAENLHYHFVFSSTLDREEAAELWELASDRIGGDNSAANITKPWRIPNTKNHPNWKKIARGRPTTPQPVELIGGTGELVDVDALRAALEAMPYLHPERHTPRSTKPRGLANRRSGNSSQPPITKADREREEARRDPRQQALPFDGDGDGDGGSVSPRDRLLARLRPELRARIDAEDGGDGDRSKHCFAVMCALFDAGLDQDEALIVATDAPFARKFGDRGDLEAEINRVYAKWEAGQEARQSKPSARPKAPKSDGDIVKLDLFRDAKKNVIKDQRNFRLIAAHEMWRFSFNEFTDRLELTGLPDYPQLDDAAYAKIRQHCVSQYACKFPKEDLYEIISVVARENRCHPVRDYLDRVQAEWDGDTDRLSGWLHAHFGAEDNDVNSAISRKTLIAAVRRVRHPGCQCKYMTVLEGPQDQGKSKALAALCPDPRWHTDNFSIERHIESKRVIELTRGKVLVEIPDLNMRGSRAEGIKAMLSRNTDEDRLAFGRVRSEVPRSFVFIGTCNRLVLTDTTGNVRFWPVECKIEGQIDTEGVERDRDQLWGAAAYFEAKGEAIHITKDEVDIASALEVTRQEREAGDEMFNAIAAWARSTEYKGEGISLRDIAKKALDIPLKDLDRSREMAIAEALRKADFVKRKSHGVSIWQQNPLF